MAAATFLDRVAMAQAANEAKAVTILRVTLSGLVLISPANFLRRSEERPFRDVADIDGSIMLATDLDTARRHFWLNAEGVACMAGWDRVGAWRLYARMPACRVRYTGDNVPTAESGRTTDEGNES
jgi:hypothetical protein